VRELLAAHHHKPAAELGAILLDAVDAFAGGAPQEDDMTIVLVKRAGTPATRSFKRRIDSLDAIFAFTAQTMGPELRRTVDFVLEELFTNVVKYGRRSDLPLRIDIGRIAGGVEVTLTDTDAEPFDVTRAPDADINLPIEQREPGGLGIHLVRKMVDSIEYRYSADERTSRITFRKVEQPGAHD
jgi:anti-sigma regulatory factor (Ser/Thr protein kinase)